MFTSTIKKLTEPSIIIQSAKGQIQISSSSSTAHINKNRNYRLIRSTFTKFSLYFGGWWRFSTDQPTPEFQNKMAGQRQRISYKDPRTNSSFLPLSFLLIHIWNTNPIIYPALSFHEYHDFCLTISRLCLDSASFVDFLERLWNWSSLVRHRLFTSSFLNNGMRTTTTRTFEILISSLQIITTIHPIHTE